MKNQVLKQYKLENAKSGAKSSDFGIEPGQKSAKNVNRRRFNAGIGDLYQDLAYLEFINSFTNGVFYKILFIKTRFYKTL